jgi:tetratricopeptide (TPR) repeat protein
METDTFSDPGVRQQLTSIVPLKLNAEGDGAGLASRFGVDSYPTLIFFDGDGSEIDRVLGYLPPDRLVGLVQRVRSGDTFLACLRELEENPGNAEAIERAVKGLLERSDPEGAIARIEAFRSATGDEQLELCRRLTFAARVALHDRVYRRAAELYRSGWVRPLDVPDTAGTRHLREVLNDGLTEEPRDRQAELLRRTRFEDAARILEIPDLESARQPEILEVADFAFRNGHYDRAGDLYVQWAQRAGPSADPEILNDIAWRLYLAGVRSREALELARDAHEGKPDLEFSDTLARVLYAAGSTAEAVALEQQAAAAAEGWRREAFLETAARMARGEQLGDRPAFESYPAAPN